MSGAGELPAAPKGTCALWVLVVPAGGLGLPRHLSVAGTASRPSTHTSSELCWARAASSSPERRWGVGLWSGHRLRGSLAHVFLPCQVLLAWSGGPSSSSMVWQVREVRLGVGLSRCQVVAPVLLPPTPSPASNMGGCACAGNRPEAVWSRRPRGGPVAKSAWGLAGRCAAPSPALTLMFPNPARPGTQALPRPFPWLQACRLCSHLGPLMTCLAGGHWGSAHEGPAGKPQVMQLCPSPAPHALVCSHVVLPARETSSTRCRGQELTPAVPLQGLSRDSAKRLRFVPGIVYVDGA